MRASAKGGKPPMKTGKLKLLRNLKQRQRRLSVCYHIFCHYAQQEGQKARPTGSVPQWLDFLKWRFTAFKSYGVKTKSTSQYANKQWLTSTCCFVHCVRISQWSSRLPNTASKCYLQIQLTGESEKRLWTGDCMVKHK